MSDCDTSSSLSDEDSYVNLGAKYRKAMTKRIKYSQKESDSTQDFDNQLLQFEDSLVRRTSSNDSTKQSSMKSSKKKDAKECLDSVKSPKIKRRCTRSNSRLSADYESDGSAVNFTLDHPNLDTIDLTECTNEYNLSVLSDLPDCIVVGSPESKHENEDDDIVTVKIIWKTKDVVKLELSKYEPLKKIFQHFAKMENVPEDHILITNKDKQIRPTDTLFSTGLTVVDILEGGVLNKSVVIVTEQIEKTGELCKLKVQSANSKKSIFITLKKNENFKSVVLECAHTLEVPPEKIKLCFDGEQIEMSDTPESLDLDQEACIDLYVTNN